MNLLVVTSTFPAGEADPVPAFVKNQLIALKRLQPDLHISVLAPHDGRSKTADFRRWQDYDEYRFHYFWPFRAERLAGRGILPALRANPLNYLLIPFLFLGEFLSLLSLTRKLKPDVIYAHWFTPQAVVCGWVSRITSIPFVFTTHASDVDVWRKVPLIGRYVVRSNTRRARAFTAVSRRSMEKLQRFFSAEQWQSMRGKRAIIPMGVELPESQPRKRPRRSDRTIILFLGRLVEKKGAQYLLSAYALARASIGDSLLVIAGDGPLLGKLKAQVVALGLEGHVSFPGFVAGADKDHLLREADIFVVPSIVADSGDAEGLPVSLLEGMAYGKICIATNESGADDILIHRKDGFLLPERDVEALWAALITATQMDPHVRDDMEAAARKSAGRFGWTTIASMYHEFLLERFEHD